MSLNCIKEQDSKKNMVSLHFIPSAKCVFSMSSRSISPMPSVVRLWVDDDLSTNEVTEVFIEVSVKPVEFPEILVTKNIPRCSMDAVLYSKE